MPTPAPLPLRQVLGLVARERGRHGRALRAAAGASLLAGCVAWAGPVRAQPPLIDLSAGYENLNQQASTLPGMADFQGDFGVARASFTGQVQDGRWNLALAMDGEGGAGLSEAARFASVTVKPALTLELPAQKHRLEITGALSFDSTGLERHALAEQWDNVYLTPAQRERYRLARAASDHFVALDARTSVVLYLSASILDRGVQTKTYGGGGFLERELSPSLRLRLGGSDQQNFYAGSSISVSGPETSLLYKPRETTEAQVKVGVLSIADSTGVRQSMTEGLSCSEEQLDLKAKVAWERGVSSRAATSELTTSDIYTLVLRDRLTTHHSVEADAEERHEDWVKGYDDGTPADSTSIELRYIYEEGGRAWWKPERAAVNLIAAYGVEQLRIKSGQSAQRQVIRLSFERLL